MPTAIRAPAHPVDVRSGAGLLGLHEHQRVRQQEGCMEVLNDLPDGGASKEEKGGTAHGGPTHWPHGEEPQEARWVDPSGILDPVLVGPGHALA